MTDPRCARTPCVVIGTEGCRVAAPEAFALGASDWVAASVDPPELFARLRARLSEPAGDGSGRVGPAMVLELTQALSSTLELREILSLVVRRVAQVVNAISR